MSVEQKRGSVVFIVVVTYNDTEQMDTFKNATAFIDIGMYGGGGDLPPIIGP